MLIIFVLAAYFAVFLPGLRAYTQGENCLAFCEVAAQCNNQCNNTMVDSYSSCVCQPSCLCSMAVCYGCCRLAEVQPLCISGADYNLNFCYSFENVVADPRCWPYTDNNSTFDFNGSFPAAYQEFLHGIAVPSGIHGNFSPQYLNIATQFATFSTLAPSTQSVSQPTTATIVFPSNTNSLFLLSESTTLANTAFVGVLTSSTTSRTSSATNTATSKSSGTTISEGGTDRLMLLFLALIAGRTLESLLL